MDKFEWAIQFVLKHEGGFQDNPNDPGNYRPDGTLVGTKYGISARSYPDLDIKNLTVDQARNIYRADYWMKLGCEQLPPREALALFDFGVNAGVSRARRAWEATGNFGDFIAERLRFYTSLTSYNHFGRGWTNRVADLIDYVSDSETVANEAINASSAYICLFGKACARIPFAKATLVNGKLYVRMF